MSFVQQDTTFQALRGKNSHYSYVWIIPGWYADRWWTKGANVVLNNGKCNTTDLAEFIVRQRVIAISHQPNILNMTSQEDGVCVSLWLICIFTKINNVLWPALVPCVPELSNIAVYLIHSTALTLTIVLLISPIYKSTDCGCNGSYSSSKATTQLVGCRVQPRNLEQKLAGHDHRVHRGV